LIEGVIPNCYDSNPLAQVLGFRVY
jgi:hypothetical protein